MEEVNKIKKPDRMVAEFIAKLKELGGTDAHETENNEKAGLTFVVSDAIGIVAAVAWLPHSTSETVRALNDYLLGLRKDA